MTLQECYVALGGDYNDVIGRLRRETMVQKFVFKFLEDTGFDNLRGAMSTRSREDAFRAAHTIKGVCQNLGFTKLYDSAARLSDELRTEWGAEADDMFNRLTADYLLTIEAIKAYRDSAAPLV